MSGEGKVPRTLDIRIKEAEIDRLQGEASDLRNLLNKQIALTEELRARLIDKEVENRALRRRLENAQTDDAGRDASHLAQAGG